MANGAVMRLTILGSERDEAARTQTTVMRYEIIDDGERRAEDRHWMLHWFDQEQFRAMVHRAGLVISATFTGDGSPATPTDTDVTVLLQHP